MRKFWVGGLALALAGFPALAWAGPKEEVFASFEAMRAAGKFRMVGSSQTAQGTVETDVAVVWPDRFHVKSQGNEFMVVPGATWMRQGGQWQKLPMDMSAMVRTMSPEAMKQSFDNMSNVQALGEKTVDGREARGYEYDTRVSMMGVEAKSHNVLWVDAETKLPIEQEVTNEVMGTRSTARQRYHFDPDLSIEAPQ
jgi:hypothetical protein